MESATSDSEDKESDKEGTDKDSDKELRLQRALRKINTFYNPVISNTALERDFCFVRGTDDYHKNPDLFDEAWFHEETDKRKFWREAINKEFSDMIKRKVWRCAKKAEIPLNRQLIGNKWVFKKTKWCVSCKTGGIGLFPSTGDRP